MTSPVVPVRAALVSTLRAKIGAAADVVAWHPAQIAAGSAVIVGDADGSFNVDTFRGAAGRRQYEETWEFTVTIVPGQCRDTAEEGERVLELGELVMTAVAETPDLGVTGVMLIRSRVTGFNVRQTDDTATGTLTVETLLRSAR